MKQGGDKKAQSPLRWCQLRHGLRSLRALRLGDYGVIVASLGLISWQWPSANPQHTARKCQIRQGGHSVGVYDLQQHRRIRINGPQGISVIEIAPGKVRFAHSPCHNHYCVQQGWLTHPNQVAVCLPNQVSIVVLGERNFDSLTY